MIYALEKNLTGMATNPDVRGIVLTGEGKAFCSGADLKSIAGLGKDFGESFYELLDHLPSGNP